MALTGHFLCRVYGLAGGAPPFENAAGTLTNFSNFKDFPVAPNTYIPATNAYVWPLVTGYQTRGGFYVYSVIEIPATGNNQPSIKFATDQSASTLASGAT